MPRLTARVLLEPTLILALGHPAKLEVFEHLVERLCAASGVPCVSGRGDGPPAPVQSAAFRHASLPGLVPGQRVLTEAGQGCAGLHETVVVTIERLTRPAGRFGPGLLEQPFPVLLAAVPIAVQDAE